MDRLKIKMKAKDGYLKPEDIDIFDAATGEQRHDFVGLELRIFAGAPLTIVGTVLTGNKLETRIELFDLAELQIGG